MTTWHSLTTKETLTTLSVDMEGLSGSTVERRIGIHGGNELPHKKSDPWWLVLLRQFSSPLIYVLVAAAVISALLGEWVDAWVIGAAVVVNTAIGFVQEFKANQALEHLRSLVQPEATVIREGRETIVDAKSLVPGDILVLRTGNKISADARMLETHDLVMNEAALTGESMPIKKIVEELQEGALLAERKNMVYAGTVVTGGRGLAVVVESGLKTELGKISSMVQETDETQTPLQEQLAVLAKWISGVVAGIIVVLFVFGLLRGESFVLMFEMSVALAVAAIPEGLLVSVTIILAIGMQRILKRRSLVRRLVGAETLGSVSIICSDKTGTITEGEMRVTDVETSSGLITIDDAYRSEDSVIWKLFEISGLCNDAIVVRGEEVEVKGSPTEIALMHSVLETHMDLDALEKMHKRIAEIPFDSAWKYMVTKHEWGNSHAMLLKGAPGKVFEMCGFVQDGEKKVKFDKKQRTQWEKRVLEATRKGLRIIAFAIYEDADKSEVIDKEQLEGFTLLGFVGLRDPLRAQAKDQIKAAKRAGVRTVVITGDHPETARAIGAEAGLHSDKDSVVVGTDLDAWSDEELEKRVAKISIYARVEPRHKIRIVKAWQARGEVVAMTGDGVNDAPALKASDIGIAVGSGTDVAKQAADVVILNNDLGTITAAIEEGRVIFDNIRKVAVYLIAGSFTEVFLIGFAMLAGLPAPLLPVQILWINFFADSFPHIGLALEKKEQDVMGLAPRRRDERVLSGDMIKMIAIIAIVANVFLLSLFFWLLSTGRSEEAVRSVMFVAVGIDTLFYVFSARTFRKSVFSINPFSNLWLVGGVSIGFAMMIIATVVPFFQRIFEIVPLSLSEWGLLLIIGLIKLAIIEGGKEWFILRKQK